MIAAWMLAATITAALLGAAASAAERVMRLWARPARTLWSLSIALAVLLPVAAAVVVRTPAAAGATSADAPARSTVIAAFVVRAEDTALSIARVTRALAPLDRPLAALWLVASAATLALLVHAARRLAHARRAWRRDAVDGVPVLVAESAGPAVVGVTSPAIVMPAWALELDAPLRALVLRHESEHLRAGDPAHLAFGALALALMPWNLALWWQARRLRTAIEIDCDARVLAALRSHDATHDATRDVSRDVSRYGLLLLAVAQRRATSSWTLLGAPALAESSTDLSRRISAMRTPLPRRRALRTALGLTVSFGAAAGAFAACSASRDVVSPRAKQPEAAAQTYAPDAERGTAGTPSVGYATKSDVTPVPGDTMSIMYKGKLYRTVLDHGDAERSKTVSGTPLRAMKGTLHVVPDQKFVSVHQLPSVITTHAGVDDTPKPQQRSADGAYFEFQVERPVQPAQGNRGPRYPEELKAARVEGTVLAQFIVEPDGSVMPGSLKVLASDHDQFTQAVRDALYQMHFEPALVGGKAVRQLVQEPFQFLLSK